MSQHGVTSAPPADEIPRLVLIVLEEERYRIGSTAEYPRPRKERDAALEEFAKGVLDVFRSLEDAVLDNGSIDLDEGVCEAALSSFAKWGLLAYREGFNHEEARALLERALVYGESHGGPAVPTIYSDSIPFPWEVLYTKEAREPADRSAFWGLRYATARILDRGDPFLEHESEQRLPSDMLFCLHQLLQQSHEVERPSIEGAVRGSTLDRFSVLERGILEQGADGGALLRYLDRAAHTMVHFACHCRHGGGSNDVLEISLLPGGAEGDALLTVETNTFTLASGAFQCRPLIFLNACQSAGARGELSSVRNLPEKFANRGAGAVIATACPVPDIFAAAFARRFYELFLCGESDRNGGRRRLTIGQALLAARKYFLEEHHNPLGLAYGLYTPSHYRLAQPPAAEGLEQ